MSVFFRTIILYLCVVFAMRVMGKRQLGELQPSELVVAIMISDLASIPVQSDDIPLLRGIIPIIALISIEFIFSTLILKSDILRKLLTGTPTAIIKNGKFILKNLRRQRICIDDITEQLRISGYNDVSEIYEAIIETTGQISIVPKESFRPLCCGDLSRTFNQTETPRTVISDGKIRKNNLKLLGLDEKWLSEKLSEYNISDYGSIFYMSATRDKKVYLQIKE